MIVRDLHHIAHQLHRLRDACQDAIVAAVGPVLAAQIAVGAEHIHHAHGQIKLFHTGLSS